jgi:UDP-glucose 4-epimerase
MFALALFKGERGATYNVANGKATAIRDLLDLLAEVSGHNPDVRSVAKFQRAGDVLFQCGENAAMTRLGYGQGRPLKDTLSWMLSSFAAS